MQKNKFIFYNLLANSALATITNAFVWFALTFWAFLTTESVLVTSFIAGTFAVFNMLCAFLFGSIVDRYRKHTAIILSNVLSLVAYIIGAGFFFLTPREVFADPSSPELWILIVILIVGSVAGNLRTIALVTLVRGLFEEDRDKANGMIGAMNGLSFSVTSVLSGLAIGFYGMDVALICALIATVVSMLHLFTVKVEEPIIIHTEEKPSHFDFRGTLAAITSMPGLLALIFFTTFNNFLGGVFMALMDPYGLSLVSVQTWGIMFAFLSLGFIAGSTYIAKYGLGSRPLRRLLLVNVVLWITCIFFTIQPSIILLGIGMLFWMTLVPFIEATEHTVMQAVVPYERLGRVIGFAQSVESAATPITAFMIGPIAQLIFIPFMTTGAGVALIGDWFGTGQARGIALVFIISGSIGLIMTLLAFRSRSYHLLSDQYALTLKKTSD
ncbi:multidrug transporter [Candidatus Kaiserbacteria bacterium RIFCSPHIGHO2_01_FULL_46_22]|uniref:Multidrug transporter n=1 Tax=Candidatus Kaiserbacteria bacterium RIFCSPHIGHO2_01_FULL_46_22 TaxID=1798475 RepID=A0A1F6BY41_9BACT|nr:MAG: multidrug transporter [Candidatus Kaiserbacteria bacterium RIFCSPHIGHO2_01_FULL_46_22]